MDRLQEFLEAYGREADNLLYRDAFIKRFEFTFEITQSVLRKFVSAYSVNLKERDNITFPNLIRTAGQDGILRAGYDVWHQFRDARNRTSHTYNEAQAVAVMQVVPKFLEEVRDLHGRLEEELQRG